MFGVAAVGDDGKGSSPGPHNHIHSTSNVPNVDAQLLLESLLRLCSVQREQMKAMRAVKEAILEPQRLCIMRDGYSALTCKTKCLDSLTTNAGASSKRMQLVCKLHCFPIPDRPWLLRVCVEMKGKNVNFAVNFVTIKRASGHSRHQSSVSGSCLQ